VHPAGVASPQSADFHGKLLRERRFAPMLDKDDPAACGRCHDGTLSRPDTVTFAAPNATPCTTCHAEPRGILACSTCHAETPRAGAHAAHVNPSASHATGLACSTCHPTVSADDPKVIGGLHGDGVVEIQFDPAVVPNEASFDPRTGACAVACHDRKGKRPRLAWTDRGPLGCNDCHSSPPAAHFPGPCTSCHREANANGTALTNASLHINGRTDLGDGSGKCGACHGQGDSPWPTTGAHAAHRNPKLAGDIACDSCHTVPAAIDAPGHLDGRVTVSFGGAARAPRASGLERHELQRGRLPRRQALRSLGHRARVERRLGRRERVRRMPRDPATRSAHDVDLLRSLDLPRRGRHARSDRRSDDRPEPPRLSRQRRDRPRRPVEPFSEVAARVVDVDVDVDVDVVVDGDGDGDVLCHGASASELREHADEPSQ
jgi:hypothetical protein